VIDFRYHIVSIVAVFLALAVGIVLGSGPLKDDISGFLEERTNQLASQKLELQEEVQTVRGDLEAGEEYARLVQPALLGGQLLTQPVVLIQLPDAAEESVRNVQAAIEEAGGRVTERVQIEPDWADLERIDDLANTNESVAPGAETSDTHELAAQLIAGALVTDRDSLAGQPYFPSIQILGTFERRGFLRVDEEEVVRGASAVFIGSDKTDEAATSTFLPLIEAIDAVGEGTVVAGPLASASEGGVVFLVRDSALADRVSTLDRVDTTIGITVTVMALIDQRRGIVGQYGTGDGSQGIAPDPVP